MYIVDLGKCMDKTHYAVGLDMLSSLRVWVEETWTACHKYSHNSYDSDSYRPSDKAVTWVWPRDTSGGPLGKGQVCWCKRQGFEP